LVESIERHKQCDLALPKQWTKNGERVHFFMLPFGGGKSMCPGRYFAINEFKITVGTLLAWFDLELLSNEVPPIDPSRTGFGTASPNLILTATSPRLG
jgi:cytochrome P450